MDDTRMYFIYAVQCTQWKKVYKPCIQFGRKSYNKSLKWFSPVIFLMFSCPKQVPKVKVKNKQMGAIYYLFESFVFREEGFFV